MKIGLVTSLVVKSGRLNPDSLGRRALHGLVWMLAQNVVARLSSLLSQLILAALLSSADFGVIGLAYTVTNIASTLLNVGIDDILMQRQSGLRLWTGPAFWISFSLSLAAAILVVLVSPLAAMAYHAPGMVGLLAVFAISMPLGALSTVPMMVLRARMRFGTVAAYTSFEIVVTAVLTTGLAWAGFGAYSFVIPVPIMSAVRAIVLWRLAASGGGFRPQVRRWKYLVGNTAANFTSRVVLMLIGQGDYILLGLLASQDAVGAYYFGFRLAAQPLWTLAGNFGGILFPALVQIKSDPKRQGEMALKASTMLSFCIMPIAMMQAAAAAPLVIGLFGQRWVAAIPIIQLLSIGLSFEAVSWSAGALLSARGGFVIGMRFLLAQMPLFFLLIVLGGLWDKAVGVAWGICIYYAVTQPVYVRYIFRLVGVTTGQVALIYLKPALYAVLSVGTALLISSLPAFAAYPLLRVAIIGAVGTVLYVGLVKFLAREMWQELVSRCMGALRRHAPA